MATAAIAAEYKAEAADAAAELEENGHIITFGLFAAPVNSWEPPQEFEPVANAAVFPLAWSADFSNDVQADDVMLMVSPMAYAYGLELKKLGEWKAGIDPFGAESKVLSVALSEQDIRHCTHAVYDGDHRKIVAIKPFTPDGITTIYYEVQMR